MAVLTYSLAKDGERRLSANFKVKEFACHDGSDAILIDEVLVSFLQRMRNCFKQPLSINSAYRTAAYNAKIGGSPRSQHLAGKAADIVIADYSPFAVAQYAESIKAGGIGYYPAGQGNFTHIDSREGFSRWEKKNGAEAAVTGFGGAYAAGTPKTAAQIVQGQAGLDDNTMLYLQSYRYGTELLEKLAKAMK